MAFIAPLIGAAAAYLGLEVAVTAAGQSIISLGLAFGTSYLARRLQAQPNAQSQGTSLSLRLTTNESREIAFGRVASAGSLKYHHTYGPHENDYVQLVFVLADHECDGLEHVYVDGREVFFDEDNYAIAPQPPSGFLGEDGGIGVGSQVDYSGGLMKVVFHSGAWDQAADTDLVAQNTEWLTAYRGRGVCYVVVTLKFDEKAFKNGMPPFLFVFRGAKLYDWRLDSTNGGSGSHRWGDESTYEWSNNAAVCLYNFHRGIFVGGSRLGGMTVPEASLPVDKWTSAANICDEEVELRDSGTEPRYTVNGIIQVLSEHGTAVRDMVTAMAGVEVDSGGTFVPLPGAAQSPVLDMADTDLIANQLTEVIPKLSRSVLINELFGTYHEPKALYAETALPPRISLDDIATDGAPLPANYALTLVTSQTQGQRILEILRRKGRYQKHVTCMPRSRFAVLESGDWITWSSDRYGWTGAQFEVLQATLNRDLTVTIEFREIATEVFAWDPNTDELDAESPLTVSAGGSSFDAVSGLALAAVLIEGVDDSERPGLRATFDAVTDLTVVALQLEYRKVGDTVALTKRIEDPGAGTYTWVEGVQGGLQYECRVQPITLPPRVVQWTAWTAMSGTTDPQVVDVASIATAVPPDTITADMLGAQERFELSLVTQTDSIIGSAAEFASRAFDQAQAAAESALAGLLNSSDNRALISVEQVTRADADSALAALITTVSTVVDGHTASIAEVLESIDGVSARWGVAIDIDGNVVGLVQLDGNADYSAFTVVADLFQVALPDGSLGGGAVPVFVIGMVNGVPKVGLRGDMLIDGTIEARAISVDSLSAITANVGELTAGIVRSGDGAMIIDLDAATIVVTAT